MHRVLWGWFKSSLYWSRLVFLATTISAGFIASVARYIENAKLLFVDLLCCGEGRYWCQQSPVIRWWFYWGYARHYTCIAGTTVDVSAITVLISVYMQRVKQSNGRQLPVELKPLLASMVELTLQRVAKILPHAYQNRRLIAKSLLK